WKATRRGRTTPASASVILSRSRSRPPAWNENSLPRPSSPPGIWRRSSTTTGGRYTRRSRSFFMLRRDRQNARFHGIPIGQFWWGFFVRSAVVRSPASYDPLLQSEDPIARLGSVLDASTAQASPLVREPTRPSSAGPTSQSEPPLAAKNKCLAKSNKSRTVGEATKKRNRQ